MTCNVLMEQEVADWVWWHLRGKRKLFFPGVLLGRQTTSSKGLVAHDIIKV